MKANIVIKRQGSIGYTTIEIEDGTPEEIAQLVDSMSLPTKTVPEQDDYTTFAEKMRQEKPDLVSVNPGVPRQTSGRIV
jgi:hypothetical protein